MPRSALHVSLTRGYLRQEENQYLVVPKEIVRRYDTRVQQLLGYQMCPPFCGWVEMQEPSIVLEDGDFTVAAAENHLS